MTRLYFYLPESSLQVPSLDMQELVQQHSVCSGAPRLCTAACNYPLTVDLKWAVCCPPLLCCDVCLLLQAMSVLDSLVLPGTETLDVKDKAAVSTAGSLL